MRGGAPHFGASPEKTLPIARVAAQATSAMRAILLGILLAMLAAPPADAQVLERTLAAQAGYRLFVRNADAAIQSLLIERAGARELRITNAARFINWRLPPGLPVLNSPTIVVSLSGGRGCCSTFLFFQSDRSGWRHLGSFPVLRQDPRSIPLTDPATGDTLWLPDPVMTYWDGTGPDSWDILPPVAVRLRGGRLAANPAAMRRPLAEALGDACLRRGGNDPVLIPGAEDLAGMLAELADLHRTPRDNTLGAGIAYAQRAACLVYFGHAAQAQLLLAAWPASQPGGEAVATQMRLRLLCSEHIAALREANGRHPWLDGECPGEADPRLRLLHPPPP